MKIWLLAGALALSAASSNAARAADFDLIKSTMTIKHGFTEQTFGIKNNTGRHVHRVTVKCGFYSDDRLLSSGLALFYDVEPGQTAYDDVTVEGEADREDCRIEHD